MGEGLHLERRGRGVTPRPLETAGVDEVHHVASGLQPIPFDTRTDSTAVRTDPSVSSTYKGRLPTSSTSSAVYTTY